MSRETQQDWTPPLCTKCGERHRTLVDVTTCLYEGAPLKDGGVWTRETSEKVWNRVWDKIDRDIE